MDENNNFLNLWWTDVLIYKKDWKQNLLGRGDDFVTKQIV